MKVCYWLGDNVGHEGDWATAANWSSGSVPVTGDVVIFDGNSTQSVTRT